MIRARCIAALLLSISALPPVYAAGVDTVLSPIHGGTGGTGGIDGTPFLAIGNGATTYTSLAQRFGERIDFKADFGAKGDTLLYPDGVVTAGSRQLSSASATFLPTDCKSGSGCTGLTDKAIYIDGANTGNTPFQTTITAYIDAHDITLAAAPPVSTPFNWAWRSLISVAGDGNGSYAPGDTINFAYGVQVVLKTTKVLSASLVAAGSNGTSGSCTLTGTTGVPLAGKFFTLSATITGGLITSLTPTPTFAAHYKTNPTALTAEPVTGCGLVGATVSLAMGMDGPFISASGLAPSAPTTLAQVSTSGSGTGAVITPTWAVAGGFHYGTDDTQAYLSAMAAMTVKQGLGKPICIYVPSGRYWVNSVAPTVSSVPVCIVGDSMLGTVFDMSPSLSGTLFSTSDSWADGVDNPNVPIKNTLKGTKIASLSVEGDLFSPNEQSAFQFGDRSDYMDIEDIRALNVNGHCMFLGGSILQTLAFPRESLVDNVKCTSTGGYMVGGVPTPTFEISSVNNASGVLPNELQINNINIYAPYGPAMVIRQAAQIRGVNVRIEGREPGSIDPVADLLQIGDANSAYAASNIRFENLELVNPYFGSSLVHLLSSTSQTKPFGIHLFGHISNSGALGKGITIDAGRASEFNFVTDLTNDYGVTVGPSPFTSNNLEFNFHGMETSVTQNIDPSANGFTLSPYRIPLPAYGATASGLPVSGGGTAATTAIGGMSNLSGAYGVCSGAAVNITGTTAETAFASCLIPAGVMAANTQILVHFSGAMTGNTNSKTYRVRVGANSTGLGATTVFQQATSVASNTSIVCDLKIANDNATNAQSASPGCGIQGFSNATGSTFSIDTTPNTYVSITGQLGVANDNMSLIEYQIFLLQKTGS